MGRRCKGQWRPCFREETRLRGSRNYLLERQKQTLRLFSFRRRSAPLLAAVCTLVCASSAMPLLVHAATPSKSRHKHASKPTPPKPAPDASTLNRDGMVDRSGTLDRSGVVDRGGPVGLPSRGANITRTAQQFKGWPYVWGGTSPKSGFDCSGLVQYVYAKWGIYLPRCASEQVNKGVPVKFDDLQAGDLVFFKNTYKRGLSHVGIFVGDGWFIHASSARTGVILSRLDSGYHKAHWYGARRLNLSKLPPVEGEDQQPARVILEEPAAGSGPPPADDPGAAPSNQ